jgi:hypothetical protein
MPPANSGTRGLPITAPRPGFLLPDGPHTGMTATLVRMPGCPETCRTPCASPHTFEEKHYATTLTPAEDIAIEACANDAAYLAGPDVLLWQHTPAFIDLLHALNDLGTPLHVQTGCATVFDDTHGAGELVRHFAVRPVIGPNAATTDPSTRRLDPDAIHAFRTLAGQGRAHFAFPAHDSLRVADAQAFTWAHHIDPAWCWVTPATGLSQELTWRVTDAARTAGFSCTPNPVRWGVVTR